MEFLGSTLLWPYIQSVIDMDYVYWCCCYVGPVCTESACVLDSVTCFVTLHRTNVKIILQHTISLGLFVEV